jgi:hypothetical protein
MCHCEEVRRSNLLFDFRFPFAKLMRIGELSNEKKISSHRVM